MTKPTDKNSLGAYTETRTQLVASLDVNAEGDGSIIHNGQPVVNQHIEHLDSVDAGDTLVNLSNLDTHRVLRITESGEIIISTIDGEMSVPFSMVRRHLRKVVYKD